MAYACKTSSARSIVGVIPYLPYSKQCKMRKRGCIVSKLLAKVCFIAHSYLHNTLLKLYRICVCYRTLVRWCANRDYLTSSQWICTKRKYKVFSIVQLIIYELHHFYYNTFKKACVSFSIFMSINVMEIFVNSFLCMFTLSIRSLIIVIR